MLGVQEVPSSNLGGPTKRFKDLQTPPTSQTPPWSPIGVQIHRLPFGHPWAACGFDAAHDQAFRFNEVPSLGTVGTVFHACRLLETTKTFVFPIRLLPNSPTGHGSVCGGAQSCREGSSGVMAARHRLQQENLWIA